MWLTEIMELIVFESEAYKKLRAEMLEELRTFLNAFLAAKKETTSEAWLSPDEARQLVGLKSRNSMKNLRDSGEVHYVKIGREYRYDKKSLEDYIFNKSTKKYSIRSKKSNRLWNP
jgi:hypothetical protein